MSNVEAQALAYALEFGAIGLTEARAWADSEILRSTSPSVELLHLATEDEVADAVALLHVLGAGASAAGVGRYSYRHLLSAVSGGTLPHRNAGDAVIRLAREGAAPSPEAESESWRFDDAFYLAETGTSGDVETVNTELEEHLKKYAA